MRGSWEQAKQSLSEELEAHLQMAIAERVRNGEDPGQARSAALRELGNIPFVEDVARDHRGWNSLENLLQDTRWALRQLRRAPAFTATAVLTLAFAIGANLGVFQLLYAVILAELPVPHPEEIVRVHAALSPFDQRRVRIGPSAQRPPYSVASNRNSLLTFDLHPTLALAALGIALMLLSLLCFSILPVALFIRGALRRRRGHALRSRELPRPRARASVPMCCWPRRSVFRFCFPQCRHVLLPRSFTGRLWMWAWIGIMSSLCIRSFISGGIPIIPSCCPGFTAGYRSGCKHFLACAAQPLRVRRNPLRLDNGALCARAQQSH